MYVGYLVGTVLGVATYWMCVGYLVGTVL